MPNMRHLLAAVAALSMAWAWYAMAATTLLPPGKQCWADIDGPLAAGTVDTYVPGGTTPKSTWQDSSQSSLNTNPIVLDADGCAIIYGVGSYRTIVTKASGSVFFDGVTTDTSAFNSVFWAGTAGGTPNTITVTYAGFNGTDGSVIQFRANATNTGSATLNPSGFGATLIQKDTTAGPVSLSGGEIIAGNVISVVYVSGTSSFRLLNTVIASASGGSNPLCGALGLQITNGGTPNSQIAITALQAVTAATTGVINRSSVAVTISTAASGANGLDTGAIAANTWYYIWLIDNGSAIAGLLSASSTAPTMPSGHTYKCRIGAIRTDVSSNLFRWVQLGNIAQYKITPATNTATPSLIAVGTGAAAFPQTANISSAVPHTVAKTIRGSIATTSNGAICSVAPNNAYTSPATIGVRANTNDPYNVPFEFVIESTNIFWGNPTGGTACNVWGLGWTDSVNAN